jgi:hypothetical protein
MVLVPDRMKCLSDHLNRSSADASSPMAWLIPTPARSSHRRQHSCRSRRVKTRINCYNRQCAALLSPFYTTVDNWR